ncbi:MAG TPA: TfoX/Sxy family protein [Beijerinckiaceae bacterium]|jgi:DNA transformation protein
MDPDSIRDLFAALGPVRVRKMFGGQGVYGGDLMFALEAGGELFLKADAETAPAFAEAGSRQFTYTREGRSTAMGYWRLPDAALDDPDEAARWGRLALEAARRAAAGKAEAARKRRP